MRRAGAAMLLGLVAACGSNAPRGVVLLGGTLVDGTGAAPLADSAVVIRDGQVSEVGHRSRVSLPKGLPVIDLRGRYLVPWLPAIGDEARLDALVRNVADGTPVASALANAVRAAGPRAQPIRAGAPARIVILDRDPLGDVRSLRAVYGRVSDGRFERAAQ